jgi:hypothetical protein
MADAQAGALRPQARAADGDAMRRFALLWLAVGLTGCLMPTKGTPVFVDGRAGEFWSGRGLLQEVSPDRLKCRVAVRNRALVVRDLWVPCASLHERPLGH